MAVSCPKYFKYELLLRPVIESFFSNLSISSTNPLTCALARAISVCFPKSTDAEVQDFNRELSFLLSSFIVFI